MYNFLSLLKIRIVMNVIKKITNLSNLNNKQCTRKCYTIKEMIQIKQFPIQALCRTKTFIHQGNKS